MAPPAFHLPVGQAQRTVTAASCDPRAKPGAAKEPDEQGLPRVRGTGVGHLVKWAATSLRIWMRLSRDLGGTRNDFALVTGAFLSQETKALGKS